MYKGQNLLELEPEERARFGLFMSFQSPVEVPGVSNAEFLRMAANARRAAQGVSELDPLEFYGFITPKVRCPHRRQPPATIGHCMSVIDIMHAEVPYNADSIVWPLCLPKHTAAWLSMSLQPWGAICVSQQSCMQLFCGANTLCSEGG